MGITNVNLKIANLKDESRAVEGEFIVDSGAFYTVLPKSMVAKLGLKPTTQREFSLADGTKVKRPLGNAFITFNNDKIASLVILGRAGDSPLMGALTLEAFGLILDPFKRQLHPAKLML